MCGNGLKNTGVLLLVLLLLSGGMSCLWSDPIDDILRLLDEQESILENWSNRWNQQEQLYENLDQRISTLQTNTQNFNDTWMKKWNEQEPTWTALEQGMENQEQTLTDFEKSLASYELHLSDTEKKLERVIRMNRFLLGAVIGLVGIQVTAELIKLLK